MSILIKGMKLPKNGYLAIVPTGEVFISGNGWGLQPDGWSVQPDGQAVELPDHGDLIDRDALNEAMYHEAFETDSEWQKWDSGCWIRYKMFERHRDSAPVVIPAERSEE